MSIFYYTIQEVNRIMDISKIYIDGDLIFFMSIAILCDIVSGIIKAIVSKNYKSSEMRVGLLKKVLDYVLVIIAVIAGYILKINYVESATVTALIFMELSSVLENCKDIIDIPEELKEIVSRETKTESEGDEDVKG